VGLLYNPQDTPPSFFCQSTTFGYISLPGRQISGGSCVAPST
jgi:hypothetical protein